MASPFQRYTGGIEASTGNLVPAAGQMAQLTANAISGFGQNLAEGIKKYNQNAAENEILDGEAQALSQQIFGFQQMFADPQTGQINPEYAPFAESLTPDIQTLAKFNSMSLNQKKGVMTGMKARFANIGQNLAAFEMTKKARLQQDMNVARGGVKEFDEQTVPTAIIPSGKMPYFYNKSYADNEAELVRLTNEAKAKGANVDLPTVLDNWRKGLKANAMSRTDLPPEVKERLVKQIEAGEGLTDNIQTDESGVTDYAKEAEMYEKASTSVKDQLAPPKVEAPANKGTAPAGGATGTAKESKPVSTEEAQAAGKKAIALENDIRALFGTRTKLEPYEQKKKDKMLAEVKALRETAASAGGTFSEASAASDLTRINLVKNKIQTMADKSEIQYLKELQRELDEGGYIGILDRTSQWSVLGGERLYKETEAGIYSDPLAKTVPQKAIVKELNAVNERRKELDKFVSRLRSVQDVGLFEGGKDILPEQKLAVQKLIKERIDQLSNPRAEPQKVTTEKIREMAGNLVLGGAKPAPKETKPEPEYALTNQQNLSLGTTTMKVATSIDDKRKDMMTFFQNKYGYVPASFEESFKAIYPEANFKTMETAYGAFMYDGKEWKQIQVQQPKTMSNKEIAEEKAVTFGVSRADGSLDFQELAPRSGIYVRGIYAGSPADAGRFRTEMLETANARVAVNRLIEINDMVGESMPWNAKLWGEAKALLPQIKAGLRTDIIGVGTVSNYEQQLIEEVVADPTKFWSLESSDRAKLAEIMRRVTNRLADKPAMFGLEVKIAGQTNAETERSLRLGRAGKSKLELDFEARGGKKGVKLDWDLTNKIPDALKD